VLCGYLNLQPVVVMKIMKNPGLHFQFRILYPKFALVALFFPYFLGEQTVRFSPCRSKDRLEPATPHYLPIPFTD
jgi:hypothetical protein